MYIVRRQKKVNFEFDYFISERLVSLIRTSQLPTSTQNEFEINVLKTRNRRGWGEHALP